KPGGFNGTGGLSAGALTGENLVQYQPEKARGGEIGAKLSGLDRRLQFNIALFYNDLSDVQLTRAVPPTVPGQAITSIVTNQGDAETKGFEIELRMAPASRLDVNLGVSYVDARFTSGCDFDLFLLNSGGLRPNFDTTKPTAAGLPLCDITGKTLPLGSPWIVNGGASYTIPVGGDGWGITTNLNFSWEDRKFIQTDNFAWAGEAFLLNARIGIRNDRFSLVAFGRNLTNEDSIALATRWFDYRYGNARRDVGTTGIFDGQVAAVETGPPRAFFAQLRKGRTFGIEATARF
ncbi:MAG: TonB-dependent receptor domain-containing protein, partial [Sphingomonadaceae bacterium]